MPKVSDLKLSKLGSNKFDDLRFRLSYIGNISVKSEGNFYEALFDSINARSDFQIKEEIPPELLHYHSIGGIYRYGKRTSEPENLQYLYISLSYSDSRILKIKDILESVPVPFQNRAKNQPSWVMNQYALLGEYDGYSVIIPCHVIGAAFYFTSSAMRKAIFSNKLESLYHGAGIHETKKVPYVFLKKGIPDSDAPFIYFYYSDAAAMKRWLAIRNDMYAATRFFGGSLASVPLKIGIPFSGSAELDIEGEVDEAGRVITVNKIYDPTSLIYPYESIVVRKYSESSPGGVEERVLKMPGHVFRRRGRNSGALSREAPSYINSASRMTDDGYFNSIEIIKEYVGRETEEINPGHGCGIVETEGQEMDASFNFHRNKGNSNVRPAETERVAEDVFTFEDFNALMNVFEDEFREQIGGKGMIVSGQSMVTADPYKKYIGDKKSYIGGGVREFVTARFGFKSEAGETEVLIIELDQRRSWRGFSTFILAGGNNLPAGITKDFLKQYASNVRLDIIESSFDVRGIKIFRKKHPDKGDKDKSFRAWGKDLYRKLKIIKILTLHTIYRNL